MEAATPTPTPVNEAVASVDPPGALWVLPDPVDGYQLLNGYSFTTRPDPESGVASQRVLTR